MKFQVRFILAVTALALSGTMTWSSQVSASEGPAAGQSAQKPAPAKPQAPQQPAPAPQAPPDYRVGPGDVMAIMFWREKEMSAEVAVRPDGMITLPLIGDLYANGLTPDELRQKIEEAAGRYVADPNATVVVRQINSRIVYITGMVRQPGSYPLLAPTTVLQALSKAGGLADFAKQDRIMIMRTQNGRTQTFRFNYKDIVRGRNLEQNILLQPGDTVVVP
jgi:polysaccharide biosynthesis/export protein